MAKARIVGHPIVMGTSVWFFLRTQPGEFRRLTLRTAEGFFRGDRQLSADPDGLVKYAQVVVNIAHRHAVEVLSVGFFQCRTLPDGTLDPEHWREITAATSEAAFGGLQLSKPTPGVVRAEHQFAKRRLAHLSQWAPTRDDLTALHGLVNRSAGRDLL